MLVPSSAGTEASPVRLNPDMIALAAAPIFLLSGSPLAAQWVRYRTRGIPRTGDGKPDLAAPAPRTTGGKPDLAGRWKKPSDKFYNDVAADLSPGDVQPWAEALYRQRKAKFGKDSMEVLCLPL